MILIFVSVHGDMVVGPKNFKISLCAEVNLDEIYVFFTVEIRDPRYSVKNKRLRDYIKVPRIWGIWVRKQ